MLELKADVEMILDRGLAAARDNDDLLYAGVNGFLDSVLNERFIDQRKHFLRLRLGSGKKARTKPSRGENRFTNFSNHRYSILAVVLWGRQSCLQAGFQAGFLSAW